MRFRTGIVAALMGFVMIGDVSAMLDNHGQPQSGDRIRYTPVAFAELPGWATDDHAAALTAFVQACTRAPGPGPQARRKALVSICRAARELGSRGRDPRIARRFFEQFFVAARVGQGEGFLTGYYEPVLEGSLTREGPYQVPILRRPDDLEQIRSDVLRAASTEREALTAGRRLGGRIVPYYTRAEIENGALAGRNLELLFLKDPIAAFFMHVQGSGRIRLKDGRLLRIGFAGKNGHPYTSIGGVLIDRGLFTKDQMNLEVLRSWMTANPQEARTLMQANASYIFFRFNPAADDQTGPIGGQGSPLSPGRSLAVDARHHVLGTPIFIDAPAITHHGEAGFRRLMITQDVGSAIKGQQRGDIYWGSGELPERNAGLTRHPGRFFVLLPRSVR